MSQLEDDLSSSGVADLETGVVDDEEEFLCKGSNNHQQAQEEERRKLYVNHFNMADDHERLSYRCIMPKDRERIQQLHEAWFPVAYQNEFYDNLVLGKMLTTNNPLYTNLICNKQDEIKACLVGMSVKGGQLNLASRRLLLPDWPHRHERAFYIMTLGTVPEFRHMGLGTSLIDELVEVVQSDRGCGTMYLHVITSNQSAIRFYERLKFWRVQEIENYYTIDGENYNCYLYARYFHGNRGHLGIVKVLLWWLSSMWHRFRDPLYYVAKKSKLFTTNDNLEARHHGSATQNHPNDHGKFRQNKVTWPERKDSCDWLNLPSVPALMHGRG